MQDMNRTKKNRNLYDEHNSLMHGKSVSNLGHVTDEVPVYYVTVCDISSFELDAVTITSMKYKLFYWF